MDLKPGSRWASQVCSTEVVVVRTSTKPVTLECGGHPMAPVGGDGGADLTLDPAFASPTSSASTPISARVSLVTSFFLAAMMPLKEGKRGSLIFSLTLTTAGSEASMVNRPSSVSRSPVILSPSASNTT